MKFSIGKAHIEVNVEGCIECGTTHSHHWKVAKTVPVTIGKRVIQMEVYICGDCLGIPCNVENSNAKPKRKKHERKTNPVLFSSEMVRAILEGCKTQTRRVVKPQIMSWQPDVIGAEIMQDRFIGAATFLASCPYGQAGDRLWVRESALPDFPKDFTTYNWTWGEVPAEYRNPKFCLYKADSKLALKWKPSIHMPRWASRIMLEVVSVRVERVQDISFDDVVAEGFPFSKDSLIAQEPNWYKAAFKGLWDSINSKRGFGWDTNPFVWALEFKRVDA